MWSVKRTPFGTRQGDAGTISGELALSRLAHHD
jgi:hypothetical protein